MTVGYLEVQSSRLVTSVATIGHEHTSSTYLELLCRSQLGDVVSLSFRELHG